MERDFTLHTVTAEECGALTNPPMAMCDGWEDHHEYISPYPNLPGVTYPDEASSLT